MNSLINVLCRDKSMLHKWTKEAKQTVALIMSMVCLYRDEIGVSE